MFEVVLVVMVDFFVIVVNWLRLVLLVLLNLFG